MQYSYPIGCLTRFYLNFERDTFEISFYNPWYPSYFSTCNLLPPSECGVFCFSLRISFNYNILAQWQLFVCSDRNWYSLRLGPRGGPSKPCGSHACPSSQADDSNPTYRRQIITRIHVYVILNYLLFIWRIFQVSSSQLAVIINILTSSLPILLVNCSNSPYNQQQN